LPCCVHFNYPLPRGGRIGRSTVSDRPTSRKFNAITGNYEQFNGMSFEATQSQRRHVTLTS
jgi:hypothetical protein